MLIFIVIQFIQLNHQTIENLAYIRILSTDVCVLCIHADNSAIVRTVQT